MIILYWVILGLLLFSYVGYGHLVILLGLLRRPRSCNLPEVPLQVCILVPAYNEEAELGAKLRTVLDLETGPHAVEIIVLSDGSTDRTNEIAASFAEYGVRLIALPRNVGKINALNTVLDDLPGEIVVLTDANSMLAPGALLALLDHFRDPQVGGVCGALGVSRRQRNWLGKIEALYWKYDHALKMAENKLAGVVTMQGSVYAIRRELLAPIPQGVADDLVIGLRIPLAGKRITFEPRASSEEKVTAKLGGELGRRVRSTEQGWRGLMMFREVLNPFRYGLFALQMWAHKVLRRMTPFLLVLLAVVNIILIGRGPFYDVMAAGQGMVYALALLGWLMPTVRRLPPVAVSLFFVMGHLAMGMGVVNVLRGKRTHQWTPVR